MTDQIRRARNWRSTFGELIIVIVGVMIALGVDAWWDERQDRVKEAEHLAALTSEIKENLDELRSAISRMEEIKASTRTLIEIVESGRAPPSTEIMVELTWDSFSFQPYNPLFTAYDNLLSTGGIRLLSDEKLRHDLAQFKASVEGLRRLDWVLDQWNRIIQPWVVNNLQLDWLPEPYRKEHQIPSPLVLTDWAAVVKDQEYKGIVINRMLAITDYVEGLVNILPTAEALAAQLDAEDGK